MMHQTQEVQIPSPTQQGKADTAHQLINQIYKHSMLHKMDDANLDFSEYLDNRLCSLIAAAQHT
eukprot:8787225-Ditylum_brightwellii.AAC.1